MKKLFVLLAIVTLLLPSCQKINDRIDGLENRIDQIEGTQIATINQQIEAINTTLPQLRETDAELKEYIQSLQTTATNLQEQITNTNKDIDELEAALNKAIADAEASDDALKAELVAQLNTTKADILAQLESTKTALEAELNQINSTIATLQAKDTELEGKITTLEEYVNTELQNTEDWATATFATLEQFNTIVEDIATIKTQIETLNTSLTNLEERLNSKIATDIATAVEGLQGELATKVTEITTAYTEAISVAKEEIAAAYTEAIATAIANLESSMKEWVNEQLTGYYTIAEIDATLNALQKSIDESNEALANDITELSEKVDAMKVELTEAYNSAIEEAINTNNGVIDGKIAESVAEVNDRIDLEVAAINARISALEERIDSLEDAIDEIKALDIIFDIDNGVACMAGATIEFGYNIVGGDNDTTVECFGDGGWSADVVSSTLEGGCIQVTAPSFGGKGKVVVLATSGAGGVCMKSIRFDEGILTDILDTYEVDYEACTLSVSLKTNLDYDLNIPSDIDWLSVVDTRAEVREDVLTFSINENLIAESRSATLTLTDKTGNTLHSFIINQKPQPVIEFADTIVKKVCVTKFDTNGDGELSYNEASKVTSLGEYFFGDYATIVKSFDELQYFVGLEDISDYAFSDCGNLVSVIIPDGVIAIGYYTFAYCHKLIDVTIPNSVTTIGEGAFWGCI
ncbi:MAG: leucine-rich repeat protein [Alistipes sp.]|nr:leucine-rich repeat protein [Alistipes sp.]